MNLQRERGSRESAHDILCERTRARHESWAVTREQSEVRSVGLGESATSSWPCCCFCRFLALLPGELLGLLGLEGLAFPSALLLLGGEALLRFVGPLEREGSGYCHSPVTGSQHL